MPKKKKKRENGAILLNSRRLTYGLALHSPEGHILQALSRYAEQQ